MSRAIGRARSPTARAADALERLVDLAELIGDRLELVLEVLPIAAPPDAAEAEEIDPERTSDIPEDALRAMKGRL